MRKQSLRYYTQKNWKRQGPVKVGSHTSTSLSAMLLIKDTDCLETWKTFEMLKPNILKLYCPRNSLAVKELHFLILRNWRSNDSHPSERLLTKTDPLCCLGFQSDSSEIVPATKTFEMQSKQNVQLLMVFHVGYRYPGDTERTSGSPYTSVISW